MKAWLTIPSARADGGTVKVWKAAGYGVALFRDIGAPSVECADVTITGRYEGYALAVNRLSEFVFQHDPECEFVIAAGDDTTPEPVLTPDTIAMQCSAYFFNNARYAGTGRDDRTFGVMQPTGDPWRDVQGRIIERIAGSPWLGREWSRRAFNGRGPMHPDFYHCFGDELLQNVAIKYGVFWQRPDLTHHHANWSRKDGATYEKDMPHFLRIANSAEHWKESKALFEKLKMEGFPECGPIPA